MKDAKVSSKKPVTEKPITKIKIDEDGKCDGCKRRSSEPVKVDGPLTPYREITLSDGHGFYIKTTCSLTKDERVLVQQYREYNEPDGIKFQCTDPIYFENKAEFLEWLIELLKNNFEKIPFITIAPIKDEDIKKHERETTDAMYL